MFQHKEFGNRAKYAGYDPVDQHEYDQETANYVPMHGADCHGHGTAVASLVGGVIHGKAKKANLYSVRVLRCDTTAPWTVVLDGLDFLAEIIPKRGDNAVVLLALSGSNSTAINHSHFMI
jgi:subtilisin family serine protease